VRFHKSNQKKNTVKTVAKWLYPYSDWEVSA